MAIRAVFGRLRRGRQWRSYLLVVLAAYGLTVAVATLIGPLRANLDNLVFDQYQRWKPRPYAFDQPVRIVDIDDESIHLLGRWPWSRRTMGQLVDALVKAGVAGVGFDFLFSEHDVVPADAAGCKEGATADSAARCEDRASGDAAFADAIADRPVVLGIFLSPSHNGSQASLTPKTGMSFVGDMPTSLLTTFIGVLVPIPKLADAASGLGFVNWLPDNDRVVRRVPLLLNVHDQIQPSLAMETLRVAQGASGYVVKSTTDFGSTAGKSTVVSAIKVGDVVVPVQADGELRVWFAASDPRRSIPAWKVLQQDADLSDLAGKLVFIGPSASLLGDIVATPINPSTPGVEAHAQLVEQILSGVTLQRPDWARGAEIVAGAALSILVAAIAPFLPIALSTLVGGIGAAILAYASWLGFSDNGVLFNPFEPMISSAFVFLTAVGQLYSEKRKQVSEVRSAFGRYVSPAVVARLAERPENLQLGGQQRQLTVMFCDIRSFTTLSEGFTAVELSAFLNEYLTPLTDIILEETGTIDKYMGDAIMAFWNAPLDDAAHGLHAVTAALAMREALEQLNDRWQEKARAANRAFPVVNFGIGLNTGECSVGNMGSTIRFSYSALGDEVNIASRLEGSSKQFGVDIVASASTRELAPDFAWLEIDKVKLKNKTRPVAVYVLAGGKVYAETDVFKRLSALHEEMLAAYRARKFSEAGALAATAATLAPREAKGLYRYYRRRLADLGELELGAAWTPMIALEEK